MQKNSDRENQRSEKPSALQVTAEYVAAYASSDSEGMGALRSADFWLDFVHVDAFGGEALTAEETTAFWPFWFSAFPELDYQVTRTLAGERIVMTEWQFTGTNSGPLGPPVLDRDVEPTGRTIQFRGISIYEIDGGLIQNETTYLDFATVLVELGVQL
jgi:steroid delta-isomerase-like uncharacterized protein